MKAKYINPDTDFGFKKIFGEEASKLLLIDFLNALLPERDKVVDLSFKNTEQLVLTDLDRKAIYDIYCENDKGEKFIVELQKAKQNYFKDRTIYYSTFPIREQAEKGEWNYNLKAVYCIGILDFTFDDYESEPERSEYLHTIRLKNQNGKVFYDKLTYVYLEMPNFTKAESQLESRLDKWLYFIKNLEDFQSIPAIFKDEVFEQALEKAELANLGPTDLNNYEDSLKIYRVLKVHLTRLLMKEKKMLLVILKASVLTLRLLLNQQDFQKTKSTNCNNVLCITAALALGRPNSEGCVSSCATSVMLFR